MLIYKTIYILSVWDLRQKIIHPDCAKCSTLPMNRQDAIHDAAVNR